MRCKQCKEKFIPKYFLQKYCTNKEECLSAFASNLRELNQKKVAKDWKQEKKVLKDKLKTLGTLENEAKKEFQKFIRIRDDGNACISCGITETNLWDGGHFYKAEIYSGLIFNEDNVWRQCRKCNRYLSGNENQYRLGLIALKGEDFVKALDKKANETRNYKYGRTELIEIKKKYQIKIKKLLAEL